MGTICGLLLVAAIVVSLVDFVVGLTQGRIGISAVILAVIAFAYIVAWLDR